MMTFLTNGAEKMAVSDPDGWMLTIISVSIVFLALFILFIIYGLTGEISKKASSRDKRVNAEITAAIALALQLERLSLETAEDDTSVATHDSEPGFITIRKTDSRWSDKALTLRRTNARKI